MVDATHKHDGKVDDNRKRDYLTKFKDEKTALGIDHVSDVPRSLVMPATVMPTHDHRKKGGQPLQITMFKAGDKRGKLFNRCLQDVLIKEALPIFGANLIMVKLLGIRGIRKWFFPLSNAGLTLAFGRKKCHNQFPDVIKTNHD